VKQYLRSTFIVLISILLVTALTACSSSSTPVSEIAVTNTSTSVYQTLTIDEFANIVAEESDEYTIVNVHIPYEGEVAETDMSIAYNDIAVLSSALPDKNAPIILYCLSGRMSEEASRALIELGYTNLYDVPGGMNAWQSSGRELLNVETRK
jgi:rhodanese-related sulfurtransferase